MHVSKKLAYQHVYCFIWIIVPQVSRGSSFPILHQLNTLTYRLDYSALNIIYILYINILLVVE